MKVLRYEIPITHEGGGTQYGAYPLVWLANKEKLPAVLYPGDRSEEFERDGKTWKVIYPVVPDDLVAEFLEEENMTVADKAEVEAYAQKHWPKREVIVDQTKVLTILAKQARGGELSAKELDALDPGHEETGVGFSKDFIEVAESYGAKW